MVEVKQLELGFKDFRDMQFKRILNKVINLNTVITILPWSEFHELPLFYREYLTGDKE